jgi:hypothetical protein
VQHRDLQGSEQAQEVKIVHGDALLHAGLVRVARWASLKESLRAQSSGATLGRRMRSADLAGSMVFEFFIANGG